MSPWSQHFPAPDEHADTDGARPYAQPVPRSETPPAGPSTPPPGPGPGAVARGPALVTLVAVLVVEALAVAAAAVRGAAAVLDGERTAVAAFVLVCAAGVAAALLACARSFWRGSSRARGVAATWQLLQGATAVALLQAGAAVTVAGGALALAAVGLVLVVTRPAPQARPL